MPKQRLTTLAHRPAIRSVVPFPPRLTWLVKTRSLSKSRKRWTCSRSRPTPGEPVALEPLPREVDQVHVGQIPLYRPDDVDVRQGARFHRVRCKQGHPLRHPRPPFPPGPPLRRESHSRTLIRRTCSTRSQLPALPGSRGQLFALPHQHDASAELAG